ncbi:MAG: endonuclease III domain-containing protein [Terriglobia bacterium]
MKASPDAGLSGYFHALLARFGPQHWWPARTRLEVILGSILTQHISWHNVSFSITLLRSRGLLSQRRLRKATLEQVESAIRPAGFFRQKARAIRGFLHWLQQRHGGSLSRALALPPDVLRRELVALRGIGPETADAILLYAANRPFFVADAYTRRILARHGWLAEDVGYEETQEFLHRHLPRDAALFNEFHALLVETAKRHCRRAAPLCKGCPLEFDLLEPGGSERVPVPAGRVAQGSPVA